MSITPDINNVATQTHTNSLFRAHIHGFVRCPTFLFQRRKAMWRACGEEVLVGRTTGEKGCNLGPLPTSLLPLSEAIRGLSGLLWSHYFFRSCWLQLWHRFLPGNALDRYLVAPQKQQWGRRPSTMTKIVQQGCLGTFCESLPPEGQSIRWQCSPCSQWTRHIQPVQKFEKKSPSQSLVKSMFTPWNITLVLRVSGNGQPSLLECCLPSIMLLRLPAGCTTWRLISWRASWV